MKHDKSPFTYSLRKVQTIIFLFASLIIFALSISIYALYINMVNKQTYHNAHERLSLFNKQRETEFSVLNTYLYKQSLNNGNIAALNTADSDNEYYHALMSIYNEFNQDIQIFSNIDGLFFYSGYVDTFLPYNKALGMKIPYDIRDNIIPRKDESNRSYACDGCWNLYTNNTNTYMVMLIRSGKNILGAWSDTSYIAGSLADMFEYDTPVYILDDCDQIAYHTAGAPQVQSGSAFPPSGQIYTSDSHIRYLCIRQPLSNSNCTILALVPLSANEQTVRKAFTRILLIPAIILIPVIILFLITGMLIGHPMTALSRILSEIQSGNGELKIQESTSRCLEVNQINRIISRLFAEIKDLKIHMYQRELSQTKIEMQLLKSQISPHFLINCFSTFTAMTMNPDVDRDLIQQFVTLLSHHLRYTFASKETISLRDECLHMDNYLELISIRYPGSLSFHLDVEDRVSDASVYPMLLMTLAENSIKHNIVMGQLLTITMTAGLKQDGATTFVHITFIDSGRGYSELALDLNNHILDHEDLIENGNNIGIYNITRALQLMFQGEAKIQFSNAPGAGARIDITIPYIPYTGRKEQMKNEYPDRR